MHRADDQGSAMRMVRNCDCKPHSKALRPPRPKPNFVSTRCHKDAGRNNRGACGKRSLNLTFLSLQILTCGKPLLCRVDPFQIQTCEVAHIPHLCSSCRASI